MSEKQTKIRHVLKAITWRFIASGTTFILALILFRDTQDVGQKAVTVALIEGTLKLIFYYYHEKIWFKVQTHRKRRKYIIKTITWRAIASITTFIVAIFIFHEDPNATEKAGIVALIEVFAKMLFYYLHEELWGRVKYGQIVEANSED